MQTITLPDALTQMREATRTILQNAIDNGPLEDVETLVMGRRMRPRPGTPALVVFGLPARASHTSQGLAEDWQRELVIASYVHSDIPENGEAIAQDLAATARKVLLEHRKLGLSYVRDVVSHRFHEEGEHQVDNQWIYSSWATVMIHFNIFER